MESPVLLCTSGGVGAWWCGGFLRVKVKRKKNLAAALSAARQRAWPTSLDKQPGSTEGQASFCRQACDGVRVLAGVIVKLLLGVVGPFSTGQKALAKAKKQQTKEASAAGPLPLPHFTPQHNLHKPTVHGKVGRLGRRHGPESYQKASLVLGLTVVAHSR